jgi:NhaP-type Na+/H+ and K+/H+ antiporter
MLFIFFEKMNMTLARYKARFQNEDFYYKDDIVSICCNNINGLTTQSVSSLSDLIATKINPVNKIEVRVSDSDDWTYFKCQMVCEEIVVSLSSNGLRMIKEKS